MWLNIYAKFYDNIYHDTQIQFKTRGGLSVNKNVHFGFICYRTTLDDFNFSMRYGTFMMSFLELNGTKENRMGLKWHKDE